jgi:hypothetical protein
MPGFSFVERSQLAIASAFLLSILLSRSKNHREIIKTAKTPVNKNHLTFIFRSLGQTARK